MQAPVRDYELRALTHDDIEELKYLHGKWFPVDYPNSWFVDITTPSERYVTYAAVKHDCIIGVIVAEMRQSKNCSVDEISLLDRAQLQNAYLTYIMTLGVREEYRRKGVASVLVTELITLLNKMNQVKGVYLHVLASNKHAIQFYERLGFGCCEFIPHYYSIMGHFQNAYCYIYYVNDGQPPPSPFQVILSSVSGMFSFIYTLVSYAFIWIKAQYRGFRRVRDDRTKS